MSCNYSSILTCGHCGLKGLARILADYTERDGETVKSPCGYLVKEVYNPWGVTYILMKCSFCDGLTLTQIEWHDGLKPEEYTFTVLYPGV